MQVDYYRLMILAVLPSWMLIQSSVSPEVHRAGNSSNTNNKVSLYPL